MDRGSAFPYDVPMLKPKLVALVASAALTIPVLGGCSSTPDYCDQLDATEQALAELRGTNILSEGTETLSARYDTFNSDVQQLISAAGEEFAEESAAVESSLAQLQSALQSAANFDLGTAAQTIGPALESVQTSSEELFTAVSTTCS